MNILTISKTGEYAGLAHRLYQEGHESVLYEENAHSRRPYPLVDSWKQNFKKADLVLCDELPLFIHGVLERNGISRLNSSLSFLSVMGDEQQREEVFHLLNTNPMGNEPEKGMYPISVVGVWNGYEFLAPYFVSFEEYTWGPGSYGDISWLGPVGTVLTPRPKQTRLFVGSLQRMEDVLKLTNYKGFIQLQGFVYQEKLLWHSVRAPCTGVTMDALAALTTGSLAGSLNALAQGTLRTWPHHEYFYSVAYRVVDTMGAMFTLSEEQLRHCALYKVEQQDEGTILPQGFGVHTMNITARADQLTKAFGRAHRTIENVFSAGVKFKPDLGRRVLQPYDTLGDYVYSPKKVQGGLLDHLRAYEWLN